PPASDQLLRLREELDLADPAASDFNVMAFDRDLALPAKGLHLPLHVVNFGKGREIEMLAPDKGRYLCEHGLARLLVAGAGSRLDHGGTLPGPSFPLVIVERSGGRDCDLR